jgi:hypothetical protein
MRTLVQFAHFRSCFDIDMTIRSLYMSAITFYSDGTGHTYHVPTVGRKPRNCVMYILTLWHRVFPEQSPREITSKPPADSIL